MRTVKVKFDNGDSITTGINGTEAEIKEYYAIGRQFNLGDGSGGDLMARVSQLHFEPKCQIKEHFTPDLGNKLAFLEQR